MDRDELCPIENLRRTPDDIWFADEAAKARAKELFPDWPGWEAEPEPDEVYCDYCGGGLFVEFQVGVLKLGKLYCADCYRLVDEY